MTLPGRGLRLASNVASRWTTGRSTLEWRAPPTACPACRRHFTTHHSRRAAPVTTASSADAEADARELRALFDGPGFRSETEKSSDLYGRKPFSKSNGLFGIGAFYSPESFREVSKKTLRRAQLLVSRIVQAPDHGPEELRRVVRNLDRLSDLLCGVIDCAELVRNTHPTQEYVEAANEAYERLCGYMNVLNTHTGLYEVLSLVLSDNQLRSELSPEAMAVAYVFLRDFEKSGIHLPKAQKAKFVSLSDEILVLGRSFLQDVGLEAGNDEEVEIPFEWLKGCPTPLVDALRSSSSTKNQIVHLARNSWELQAISQYARDPRARKVAHMGTNSGSRNRVGVLEKLLQRRGDLAALTGNESFASMTLGDKMAQKPENVQGFLTSLSKHHRPVAEKTLDKLRSLKQQQEGSRDFYAWDRDYYAKKFMATVTSGSIPPITPFFSVGTIFAGLSRLFERLYGIHLRAAEIDEGEAWHTDVCRMDVVEEGKVVGVIYADLFNRAGKSTSAAHYTVRCSRRTDDDDEDNDFRYGVLDNGQRVSMEQAEERAGLLEVESVELGDRPGRYQLPIVVLLCDFARPTVHRGPTLLEWHDVETLFHEMGHAIHSMIGRTEYHNVSGTRCATDFVELPSILMEHFLSSPEVIGLVARHHSTNAPLPYHHLTSYLQSARALDSLDVHNQILLASLDQLYHSPLALQSDFSSTKSLQTLQDEIGIVPAMKGATWQANFTHLFGYGATYYSYLFDRVIAARLWSKLFDKDPLSREKGEIFKKGVLAHGGGKDPWSMLANVLQDEDIQKGAEDAGAMQAVGRWGVAEVGTK